MHIEALAALDADRRERLDKKMAHRLLGDEDDAPWRSLESALSELEDLLEDADEDTIGLLDGLSDYLLARRDWAKATLRLGESTKVTSNE